MKKICTLALAILPMTIAAQSLVVKTTSGETIKYPVADIERLWFDTTEEPPVADNVPLSVFTDAALQSAVAVYDTDGDGELSAAEIAAITELDITGSEVASLDGIENLTSLKKLDMVNCPNIAAIDFEGKLDNIEYINAALCSSLASVKLGSKPALKTFIAFGTPLATFDFTDLSALESLTVYNTKLTSLTLTDIPTLTSISAGCQTLESIDLSGCTGLVKISLDGAENISEFDLTSFPKLQDFTLTHAKILTLATTNNKDLRRLTLDNCDKLKSLDVSRSLKLNYLSCYFCYTLVDWDTYEKNVTMSEGQTVATMNGIYSWCIKYVPREYPEDIAADLEDETFRAEMLAVADTDGDGKISVDEAKAVTTLDLSGKGLTSVDFTNFNEITELNLADNNLTDVDLALCTKITNLNLSNNQIQSLNVDPLTSLQYLNASHNEIASIGASGDRIGTSAMIDVDLSYNKLTRVTFYYKSKLTSLNLSHNEITSADIRDNDILSDLDVSYNGISSITMWSLKALVNVKFNNNPFTQLDDSKNWVVLETIDCSNTNISTLNLSQTTVLKECNATDCANLETIYIGDNTTATISKDDHTTVVEGAPAE